MQLARNGVYPLDRKVCNDLHFVPSQLEDIRTPQPAGVRTAEVEVTDIQAPSAGNDSHMRKS
jgi:hypothetical protein